MRQPVVHLLVSSRNKLIKIIKRRLSSEFIEKPRLQNELIARDIASQDTVRFEKLNQPLPCSFHEALNYRTSKKILSDDKLPEWELNNKVTARKFVETLDLLTPKQYQYRVPHKSITFSQNSVIKPYQGASSKNVYIYKNKQSIYDIGGEKNISFDEMKNNIKNRKDDRWIVEELVSNSDGSRPADIKVYCFYGKAVMGLEKSHTGKFCFWDIETGKNIDAGKYSPEKTFLGKKIHKEAIATTEKISSAIPAPFVRIDLLTTDSATFFGEITPRPGGYDRFNIEIDAWLGQSFIQAEQRLFKDLLEGKKFDTYKSIVE